VEAIWDAASSVDCGARREVRWERTRSRLSIIARASRHVSCPMGMRLLTRSVVASGDDDDDSASVSVDIWIFIPLLAFLKLLTLTLLPALVRKAD